MWIGYVVVCLQAYVTIDVMSEACIIFPTSGAFIDHAARFVDPACGFAIGMLGFPCQ
jgi:amino acid transporter